MVWAIGDIQGCYDSFMQILKKIDFDPKRDRLWVAGDLVNRGKDSLKTLRYLYSIRESIEVVLGNHDIALIAAYLGIKKSNPTIEPILKAEDAGRLIAWLRSQKFLHIDKKLGYAMSHAGISPEFDLATAIEYAQRLEKRLQSDSYEKWLTLMFHKSAERFDLKSDTVELDRYILGTFIRMRFCYSDGRLDFAEKGAPRRALREQGLLPWFECDSRKKIDLKIIFGHWSTLGYYNSDKVCALDTGCLWGGKLSVLRLDGKEKLVQVECDKQSQER